MNMKLSNQGLSSREEFKKFILSIGFKDDNNHFYRYKEFIIYLYSDFYDFCNGSEWIRNIDYNDLTPLRKFDRGYKLKKILG